VTLSSCLLALCALSPRQAYGPTGPQPAVSPNLDMSRLLRGGQKNVPTSASSVFANGYGFHGMRSMPLRTSLAPRMRPAPSGPSYVDPGAARAALRAGGGAAGLAGLAAALGQGGLPDAAGAGLLDPTNANKWGLVPAATQAAAPPVPALLLESLTGGPLTEEEADTIVAALTGSSTAAKAQASDNATASALNRLLATAPDPELQSLFNDLDTLLPAADPTAPRPIDADLLRSWFQALDTSKDAALSFLEWRDRTGLLLDLFRRVDQSGEGLVTFEEFARAMIISGARAGNRPVDPALLEWALESGGMTPADAEAEAAKIEALSGDDLVLRARGEVAAAALQLRAEQAKLAAQQKNGKPVDPKAEQAKKAAAKLDAAANLLAPKPLSSMGAPRQSKKKAKAARGY
jgi:hypothetical protein